MPRTFNESLGVANPGIYTETVVFAALAPPELTVQVTPGQVVLPPEGFESVELFIQAPAHYASPVDIIVVGSFMDMTPGTMDWTFHVDLPVPVERTTWGLIKALFREP